MRVFYSTSHVDPTPGNPASCRADSCRHLPTGQWKPSPAGRTSSNLPSVAPQTRTVPGVLVASNVIEVCLAAKAHAALVTDSHTIALVTLYLV